MRLLIHAALVVLLESRQKRNSYFDDVDTEHQSSPCDGGEVAVDESSCMSCGVGYYADQAIQQCIICPLDTFSLGLVDECLPCEHGLGTLEMGSTAETDCQDICTVPDVSFAVLSDTRVINGGSVTISCNSGFYYGNKASNVVQCGVHEFRNTCIEINISAEVDAVIMGTPATLTCTVTEQYDTDGIIKWEISDDSWISANSDPKYTIDYKLPATNVEVHGMEAVKSETTLTISNFTGVDASWENYGCKLDYSSYPDWNEYSDTISISVLDVQISLSGETIQTLGNSLKVSCTMVISPTYSSTTIGWRFSDVYTISSGITTAIIDNKFTSELSLEDLTLDSAGVYTCDATYATTDGARTPVTISESEAIIIRGFSESPKSHNALSGSSYTLRCLVVGEKQAGMNWTKTVNGQEVSTMSTQVSFSENNKTSSILLEFGKLTVDDAADYKCLAVFDSVTIESNPATIAVYEISVTAREVKIRTQTSLRCVLTNLKYEVWIFWTNAELYLQSGYNGYVISDTAYSSTSLRQESVLTVWNSTSDTTYTCQVSYNGTVVAIKETELNVYDIELASQDIDSSLTTTLTCFISDVSDPLEVTWFRGNDTITSATEGFTENKGSVINGKQEATLTVDPTYLLHDTNYTCQVKSTRYPESEHARAETRQYVYNITTSSFDILSGMPGELGCGVSRVNLTAVVKIEWFEVDDTGTWQTILVDDTDFYSEYSLDEIESKYSILTIPENLTYEDRNFICRIIIGNGTITFDKNLPLKTFDAFTERAEVRGGETASLTCTVVNPSDQLDVIWLSEEGEIPGTLKKTVPDQTTMNILVVDSTTVDMIYTCRVHSGAVQFDITAELEVNDLFLEPNRQIRAFANSIITLYCSNNSTILNDGRFYWLHEYGPCDQTICKDSKDTPKSSDLTLVVDEYTSGNWRCAFIKQHNSQEIKSNDISIMVVAAPKVVPVYRWGVSGTWGNVSCTSLPHNLTFSELSQLRWTLNGREISSDGTVFTKTADITRFWHSNEQSVEDELYKELEFTYSINTQGLVECHASYNTGEVIKCSETHMAVIEVTSQLKTIILVSSADPVIVNFVTKMDSIPETTLLLENESIDVNISRNRPDIQSIRGGIQFSEDIEFSSPKQSITDANQLSLKQLEYTYEVNDGLVGTNGKIFIIGETFAKDIVWVAVGESMNLKVYFTVLKTSKVEIKWQIMARNTDTWSDLPTDYNSHSVLISDWDPQSGVSSSVLFVPRVTRQYMLVYRAIIYFDSTTSVTTPTTTVKEITAILRTPFPVFEMMEPAAFLAEVVGPEKPSKVLLVHRESGREAVISLDSVAKQSPFSITYNITNIFQTNEGSYYFKIEFPEGLKITSNDAQLDVKRKCKYINAPINTQIHEVKIPGTYNYKLVVECVNPSHILMKPDRAEAICDTDTGILSATKLTACARTIKPSTMLP